MATTKELLESTIRKVASNAIGRNPTTGITIAVNETSTDWQSYTPPKDGFVKYWVSGCTDPVALHLKDFSNNPAIETLHRNYLDSCCHTPRVYKGRTCCMRVKGTHTGFSATFFESIGGGIGSFLKRLSVGGCYAYA